MLYKAIIHYTIWVLLAILDGIRTILDGIRVILEDTERLRLEYLYTLMTTKVTSIFHELRNKLIFLKEIVSRSFSSPLKLGSFRIEGERTFREYI